MTLKFLALLRSALHYVLSHTVAITGAATVVAAIRKAFKGHEPAKPETAPQSSPLFQGCKFEHSTVIVINGQSSEEMTQVLQAVVSSKPSPSPKPDSTGLPSEASQNG